MMSLVLFGLTSFAWGAMGLITAVVPHVWKSFLPHMVSDVWRRFWLAQIMIFVGLILTIGTINFQGFWLWMTCGVLSIVKASILLGGGQAVRTRLVDLIEKWPLWAYRLGGVVALALATLLATDVILHGR